MALGDVADRNRDRSAGVLHGGAANQTVGRVQRDGPHGVVTDVAGDLEGEGRGVVADGAVDVERVEELRHLVGSELDVDDRTDDPGNPPDATLCCGGVRLVLL